MNTNQTRETHLKVSSAKSNARYFRLKKIIYTALAMSNPSTVSAFHTVPSIPSKNVNGRKISTFDSASFFDTSHRLQPNRQSTVLLMSSIGQEPEENNPIKSTLKKLPPPPEDQFSIMGDFGCLFLYSFLDHFVNRLYDKWMNSPEIIDLLSPKSAIESSYAAKLEFSTSILQGDLVSSSLPVWFDSSASAPFGNVPLNSALPLEHHISYAPAISTAGMASVLLCSAWFVSGYFTGAFRFKNTMECSPSKAIVVTGKTWILSSLIMLAIAWGSDSVIGCVDCLHKSVGITKADADYIFDSLSVLLLWRYILSSFFGYDDGDADNSQ